MKRPASFRSNRVVRSHLLAILSVWACGDNPGEPPSWVVGRWEADWVNLAGGTWRCSLSDVVLQFSQRGAALVGTYEHLQLCCNGVCSGFYSSGSIVNVQVSGNAIAFDLDDPDFLHNTGTFAGASMSGSATWHAEFQTPVTLVGTWSATRL